LISQPIELLPKWKIAIITNFDLIDLIKNKDPGPGAALEGLCPGGRAWL